jgi:hypothetical protein
MRCLEQKRLNQQWFQAVNAALLVRERTGFAQHVQISMLDAASAFMWPDTMANATLRGEGIRQGVVPAYRASNEKLDEQNKKVVWDTRTGTRMCLLSPRAARLRSLFSSKAFICEKMASSIPLSAASRQAAPPPAPHAPHRHP